METYTNARQRVQRAEAQPRQIARIATAPNQAAQVADGRDGASFSRASRKILSREDGLVESPIPRSDFGVLDTMKLRLDIRRIRDDGRDSVIASDFKDLQRDGDWFPADVSSCGRNPPVQRIIRRGDCVRISEYDTCIIVEASIPRLFGLTNVSQHLLSDDDTMALLNETRFELLPRLTSRSAMPHYDQHWHLTRLDVSINFKADAAPIIEMLRHARHPSIRNEPDVYGHKGVGLYGSNRDFILYDAHTKHRRNRLKRKVRDKLIERAAPGTLRLEFRCKCATSVRAALEQVNARASALGIPPTIALPYAISRERRGTTVGYATVRNWLLHEMLAREVLALTGVRGIGVPQGEGSLVCRCGVRYIAEHPELLAELEAECSAPTLRKYRQLVLAHQLQVRQTNLLHLAWSSPHARRLRQAAAIAQRTAS